VMNFVHRRFFLPFGQLVLALACHIYEPHEYRVGARRDGAVNNPEYTLQHSPAPVGMISRGVNFPALVLAYPLRNAGQAIFERNGDYTLIWIGVNDLGFFIGIVFFWYGVARIQDRNAEKSLTAAWATKATTAGLVCGAIFGVLTGAYAIQMASTRWRPEREIGAFGVVWGLVLIAYFIRRLASDFGTERR
jgi:hypothetical protein